MQPKGLELKLNMVPLSEKQNILMWHKMMRKNSKDLSQSPKFTIKNITGNTNSL